MPALITYAVLIFHDDHTYDIGRGAPPLDRISQQAAVQASLSAPSLLAV